MFKTVRDYYQKLDKELFWLKIKLDSMVEPICRIIDRSAGTILDVGCGQGYPIRLIRLIMKPRKIVGVDLFEKYVRDAKKEKLHDRYLISDVRSMAFKSKSFDVVIASQIIEHLPKKDSEKFIRDLERIARKQVIIATPIGEMYHPAVDENELQLHLSHYYPQDFERMGYKVVKYGRKLLLGEEGLVHKIKLDPLRKLIFLFNILISPLYYLYQPLADYYFVAYKKLES